MSAPMDSGDSNFQEGTQMDWSRIHERTRLLGVILRVLRLEVSVYIDYIANQFQTLLLGGEGGRVKSFGRGDSE